MYGVGNPREKQKRDTFNRYQTRRFKVYKKTQSSKERGVLSDEKGKKRPCIAHIAAAYLAHRDVTMAGVQSIRRVHGETMEKTAPFFPIQKFPLVPVKDK